MTDVAANHGATAATPQAGPELLTHSRSACASTCLRKHFLRYELGLAPIEERENVAFGVLYHGALERSDLGHDDVAIAAWVRGQSKSPFIAEAVLNVWMGHRWYWQNDAFAVIESEKLFEIPLRNPETGGKTPLWRNAGKRDRIVRMGDGRAALQEYKTTTDDVSPGSDYWARLRLDQQVSRYMLAARSEGIDVATVVYDVTRRPLLKPYLATPMEERKYTEKASKLKDGTIRPAGSLYANQRANDETPLEYGARIADAIAENPSSYFVRMEIARTDDDLIEFEQEMWDQAKLLGDCRRHGRWYRNTQACLTPYRCDFLAICAEPRLVDRVAAGDLPPGFKLADKHPELAAPAAE